MRRGEWLPSTCKASFAGTRGRWRGVVVAAHVRDLEAPDLDNDSSRAPLISELNCLIDGDLGRGFDFVFLVFFELMGCMWIIPFTCAAHTAHIMSALFMHADSQVIWLPIDRQRVSCLVKHIQNTVNIY